MADREAGASNTNATRTNTDAALGSPEAQPQRKKAKEAPDWHSYTQPYVDGGKEHATARLCMGCGARINKGCASSAVGRCDIEGGETAQGLWMRAHFRPGQLNNTACI